MSRILFAMLVPVAAAVALLTLVVIDPSLGGKGASAATGGPEMALSITDPEGACSEGTCDIPAGAPFTLAVEIVQGPADGYILAQSFIDFGPVLTYEPSEEITDEIVWPDCLLERAIRAPLSDRTYVHGCITATLPPLPSSFYQGNLIELSMTCSDANTTSEVRLLPNGDPLARTNGALFTAGDTVEVVPKVTSLTIHCGTEAERITPVPIPTPRLTWTVEIEPEKPRVGDSIKLTLFAEGPGAVPLYMLFLDGDGGEPTVRSTNRLGVPVSYELEPETAGDMKFELSVNYEVANCAGTGNEGCVFFFDTEQGPQVVINVHERARMLGDVDCDGVISSNDSSVMLQRIAGLIDTFECEKLADVNGDGTLDAKDALLILQFNAGLADLPFESSPDR